MHAMTAVGRPNPDLAKRMPLECSFCGRDADRVRYLCGGEFGGTICERCIMAAAAIVLRAGQRSALGRPAA